MPSSQIFDVLKMRYEWDERYLSNPAANRWRCYDLYWDHAQYSDITVNPVEDLTDFSSFASKVKLDEQQDCVINQANSVPELFTEDLAVEVDDGTGTGATKTEIKPVQMANFRVHFFRRLQTSTGVQDAQLNIGDLVDISFSFNANADSSIQD